MSAAGHKVLKLTNIKDKMNSGFLWFGASNHLNFGANTDSFLGIGSGFLTDRNVESLKSSFSEYFEFLNNYIMKPSSKII